METKIVTLNKKDYEISELRMGDYCDIQNASIKIEDKTGIPITDMKAHRIGIILAGVKNPKLTKEQVENMPMREANMLYAALMTLNTAPFGDSPSTISTTNASPPQKQESPKS